MNAAAPWLLPTNGRITVTVKPRIGAYTRFRTLPAVPWLHVRNQEKRFAREHFAFARQQKRFPREHFAFAHQQKRFAREHLALLVSKSDFLVSISLLLVSKSDLLVSVSLLLVRKSDLLVSVSLLLVRKSDLLVSVLLLLVSKSDFLVADGLPSFSDDPSTRLRLAPPSPRGEGVFSIRSPHYGVKRIVLPPNLCQQSPLHRIYRRLSPLYKPTQ